MLKLNSLSEENSYEESQYHFPFIFGLQTVMLPKQIKTTLMKSNFIITAKNCNILT